MLIYGFQKLTLLDVPGKVGCTVFTGACNFRCPFCQNGNLVLDPAGQMRIPTEDVLTYLKKRKGILEGVCITGGEPTLQFDLLGFLAEIRTLGYEIKLDTNGYRPEILKEAVQAGLVDMVAMDLKNSPQRYAKTCGMDDAEFQMEKIRESVDYLLEGRVEYEFRTTVMRELHDRECFEAIGEWIRGAKKYYLQAYRDSDALLGRMSGSSDGFTSYSAEELKAFSEMLATYEIGMVGVRGVS